MINQTVCNVSSSTTDIGCLIWPSYPKGGAAIGIILGILLFLLLLRFINDRKKERNI